MLFRLIHTQLQSNTSSVVAHYSHRSVGIRYGWWCATTPRPHSEVKLFCAVPDKLASHKLAQTSEVKDDGDDIEEASFNPHIVPAAPPLKPKASTSSSRSANDYPQPAKLGVKKSKSQWVDPGNARWPEIVCVLFAIVADSLVRDVVNPYAADWVKDSFHRSNVAVDAGILIGSFTLASAVSSPFFGWWSDSIGRRILLAAGLIISGVSTLTGALSGYFAVVVATRFIAGLMDANQAVSYAAIGDLATGQSRQTAFGMAKAATQVARVLTYIVGGYTYGVEPGKTLEDLPGYHTILLSQIIAIVTCIFAFLLLVVVYREGPDYQHAHSVPRPKATSKTHLLSEPSMLDTQPSLARAHSIQHVSHGLSQLGRRVMQSSFIADCDEPTLLELCVRRTSSMRRGDGHAGGGDSDGGFGSPGAVPLGGRSVSCGGPVRGSCDGAVGGNREWRTMGPCTMVAEEDGLEGEGAVVGPTYPPAYKHARTHRETSNPGPGKPAGLSQLKSELSLYQQPSQPRPTFLQGLKYIASSAILVRLTLVSAMIGLLNGSIPIAITLLAEAHNGFNMNQAQASLVNAMYGAYCVAYVMLVFKPVVNRLGQKRANALGFCMTGLGLIGLSLTAMLVPSKSGPALWGGIVVSVVVSGSGYMMMSSIVASLISSHTSPEYQGISQGVNVFVLQILGGVGPIFSGALFSWAESRNLLILANAVLASMYLLCMAILAPVPRRVLEASHKY